MKWKKKEEKKKPSGSFSEVWEKRGQETDAANDFRKKIEMEITEARPGYAVGEIVLKPWHMNILGIVHGGRPCIHWRIPWAAPQR